MAPLRIIIDTNVLMAGFRSRRGASHRLLTLIDAGYFEINVSVPLVLEYEDVLNRPQLQLSADEVSDVVDYLCAAGNRHDIYFLWRPHLSDPKDDMILELAVTAGCGYIVTFNERHFRNIQEFGVEARRPSELLRIIGEL